MIGRQRSRPGAVSIVSRTPIEGYRPLIALVALLLAFAGCGGGQHRAQRAPSSPYVLSGPACLRMLAERGIAVQPWNGGSTSCPVDTPVSAAAGAMMRFAPSLKPSCAMLVAWSDFEAAIDRAARDYLRSRVVAIRHYGSFACRPMTGNSDRPSLHAQARALDIAGFELADGRIVTVESGWRGPRDEQRFLRAVAAAACRHFSVTLTPDSDRLHRNHLHVDIGPWRTCG
jgi:hypothetical protein